MDSGESRPGSVNTRGNRIAELALNRGNEIRQHISEAPNESSYLGLWEPGREPTHLESARVRLAVTALVLLGLFILAGMGSITWVTLAGKSAAELGIFMEIIATPLFGLVMLVVGYFFGHSTRHQRKRCPDV
jgi:hypothetical protein